MLATNAEFSGFPPETWLWFAALAFIPQLIGHNSLVWAVRYVGATTVALIVLLEPLGSGALAFLLFDERPTLLHGASSAVLIAGLAIVLRSRPER
jgi:drug/metabolite transporter (DMT)-like permease